MKPSPAARVPAYQGPRAPCPCPATGLTRPATINRQGNGPVSALVQIEARAQDFCNLDRIILPRFESAGRPLGQDLLVEQNPLFCDHGPGIG